MLRSAPVTRLLGGIVMASRIVHLQVIALFICGACGILASTSAEATSGHLAAFNAAYPGSTTGSSAWSSSPSNASCMTCHGIGASGGPSFGSFNRYGAALSALGSGRPIAERLASVQGNDSDGEGHTNLEEINANAQPGWCTAAAPGCNNNGFAAPSSVALLDPAAANQVPTANPGGPYSATVGTPVNFDGSGSIDPDGSIASYAWTFGDGSSGSGIRPSATYANAGSFTVTLTVTDDRGASSQPVTTTVTVNVGQQPPTASPGGPYAGTINQQVAFDGTGSSDPDGSVVSYAWMFGDGNSGTGPTPTHIYTTGGAFTVTLTVTDNDNLNDASTTTANITDGSGVQPPVANAGGPYAGNTGIGIQLDGSGSVDPDGTIAAYDWDFGDGSRASGARPVHAYAAAGLYTVTLVVTDNVGQQGTASTTADVTDAPNRAPVADPGGPYSAEPGTPVSFDGSGSSDADGTVASYAWDFGDGNVGSGSATTHAYSAAGTYTVTLTVTDDLGLDSAAASTQATIRQVTGGAALYDENCAACHGDPWGGPAVDTDLAGMKRVAGARACSIEGAIFGTSVFPDGVPDMVGFGNQQLSPDEVAAIADYLGSRDVGGEQRYIAACAGCHGNDARGGRVDESVVGENAEEIGSAIREERTMQFLSCLPPSDLELMGAFLAGGGAGWCGEREDDCDDDGRRDDVDDDDDNDGMPDDYEESKGFNPRDPADAKQDADRDGKTNVAEYRAGTDPLDPSSTPSDSSGGVGSVGAASLLGLLLIWLAGQRRRPVAPATQVKRHRSS